MLTPDGTPSRRASASLAEMKWQSAPCATAMGTGARATRSASARSRALNSWEVASSGGSNNVARLDMGNPEGMVGDTVSKSHDVNGSRPTPSSPAIRLMWTRLSRRWGLAAAALAGLAGLMYAGIRFMDGGSMPRLLSQKPLDQQAAEIAAHREAQRASLLPPNPPPVQGYWTDFRGP